MQCEKCDNTANVYFSKVVDGEEYKQHLCLACAQQQQLISLQFLDAEAEEEATSLVPAANEAVCSCCGSTAKDITTNKLLGCANCYQIFPYLIENNRDLFIYGKRHVGKQNRYLSQQLLPTQIAELEQQLAAAVKSENYEQANVIKQALEKIKPKIQ